MSTRRRKALAPTPDRIAGQVRALLAAAGGLAVGLGAADQETVTQLVGVGTILAPMVWSWWAKP